MEIDIVYKTSNFNYKVQFDVQLQYVAQPKKMMVYNMNQRSYIQVINLNMIYNHIKFSFIPSTDLQRENTA